MNRPGGDWEVWIEMSVVFDDSLEGVPTRVDATYGFWLHATAGVTTVAFLS